MNDATHAAYQAYLRQLADALLLRDWEIELERDCADSDCWASVWVMDVENYASIKVRWPYFFQKSPEEIREILTHELIHCHTDRAKRVMTQLADHCSENSACQFAREAHRKELEIIVQRCARLLAPGLPLPPEVPA